MAVYKILNPLWSLSTRTSPNVILKTFMAVNTRTLSHLVVTKNISLISKDNETKITDLKLHNQSEKPCVILLSWLMAKRKHMRKFVDFYIENDFDVLCINITPWQVLWPSKGSQVVAADILKFMDRNYLNNPCVLHGFSVGAYLWSEVMVQMAAEQDRYKPVIDKIVGQIWDSAADVTELSVGLPFAVFPNNIVMQKALSQYIIYHMKTFNSVATRHYVRASQMFSSNLLKTPVLLFLSKSDTIGAVSSNLRAKEMWEDNGMKVYWKCWDKSPHVGHFLKHREEYVDQLKKFLEDVGLGARDTAKFQAKL